MSLELISTLASVITAVVVGATAVAALVQLRHLRAGNQINGFLTLRMMLDDEQHQRAQALFQREGDLTQDPQYEAAARETVAGHAWQGDRRYPEVRAAVGMIANAFEVMGTLVRNGIVDQRLFLEQYCGTIAGMWRRLGPYIKFERRIQQDDGVWEDFEYLAALSQRFLIASPSVYPKDVPRLVPPQRKPEL